MAIWKTLGITQPYQWHNIVTNESFTAPPLSSTQLFYLDFRI